MLRKLMALICGATLAMASASAAARDWYGALHVGKGWKDPAHMAFAVTMPLPAPAPWDEFDGTYNEVPAAQCAPQPVSDVCVIQASDHSREWDANWHIMAGVEWAFHDRWEAGLGWGYIDLRGLSFELSDGVDDQGNPHFLGGDP